MQFLRRSAHYLIRSYQLTLSSLMGRQCRYLPTCSEYTDDAIQKHGLWAGGWMGAARICRCGPGGASGYDPAPDALPANAKPWTPWRYGHWRAPLRCEEVEAERK
ncbi:MAG: membrane protein insertion efficiency factor YidD [Beijerinckiaceae bacterium]